MQVGSWIILCPIPSTDKPGGWKNGNIHILKKRALREDAVSHSSSLRVKPKSFDIKASPCIWTPFAKVGEAVSIYLSLNFTHSISSNLWNRGANVWRFLQCGRGFLGNNASKDNAAKLCDNKCYKASFMELIIVLSILSKNVKHKQNKEGTGAFCLMTASVVTCRVKRRKREWSWTQTRWRVGAQVLGMFCCLLQMRYLEASHLALEAPGLPAHSVCPWTG